MVYLPAVVACMALAMSFTSLTTALDTNIVEQSSLHSTVFRQGRELKGAAPPVTQELVDSYFAGSGFPKAGRTLDQKIKEAKAFLDVKVPESGNIGTGVAVVYEHKVVLAKGYGLQTSTDPAAETTKDSIFQIGSVSKTFIAVGVALLVNDGKLDWRDPVKKHLPWFQLVDKYAEEHMTVSDLLAMNSGFARQPELATYSGQFKTERDFVRALNVSEPQFSLREIPLYANTNYEILAVMIEERSGKSWPDFLKERVWKPLDMHHTFASARTIPASLLKSSTTSGHVLCNGTVQGPYSLISPHTELAAGDATGLVAAGSIVSSAADMATFARFLLNKGSVGTVKLLQSPATIATMMTGKNLAAAELLEVPDVGIDFFPDGSTLSAGYGFDYVGDVIWGHAYAMKGGSTPVHTADLSLAPRNGLGVVVLANTQGTPDQMSLIRAYVMGIFLDVPKDVLDFELKKRESALVDVQYGPPSAVLPSCGFLFWKNPAHVTLTPEQSDALVGTYTALISPDFFSKLSITRSSVVKEFLVEFHGLKASYFAAGSENSTWFFKASEVVSNIFAGIRAIHNEQDGSFTIMLAAIPFKKQQ